MKQNIATPQHAQLLNVSDDCMPPTPTSAQIKFWHEHKAKHPNAILLMSIGAFYICFEGDADDLFSIPDPQIVYLYNQKMAYVKRDHTYNSLLATIRKRHFRVALLDKY